VIILYYVFNCLPPAGASAQIMQRLGH